MQLEKLESSCRPDETENIIIMQREEVSRTHQKEIAGDQDLCNLRSRANMGMPGRLIW